MTIVANIKKSTISGTCRFKVAFLVAVGIDEFIERLDEESTGDGPSVLFRCPCRMAPRLRDHQVRFLQQHFAFFGVRGIDAAFLNADIQVFAEQSLHFIVHPLGKQEHSEIRGADGIGFGHNRLALVIVALQSSREGESQQQGQQAQNRGEDGIGSRDRFCRDRLSATTAPKANFHGRQ